MVLLHRPQNVSTSSSCRMVFSHQQKSHTLPNHNSSLVYVTWVENSTRRRSRWSRVSGEQCEADVDECEWVRCQNGGACRNLRGSFRCACAPGFRGSLCELPGEYLRGSLCELPGEYLRGSLCELPGEYLRGSLCELPGEYLRGFRGSLCELPGE